MSHEIRVPRLGWSMEEGTFVGWLKQPGDSVRAGEPLFELEGDKATQAVESLDSGTLHVPPDAPGSGATVAVGTLLGYLLEAGEAAPVIQPASAPVASSSNRGGTDRPSPTRESRPGPGTPIASPRARRRAQELGVDWVSLRGSGRDGRIREADVAAAASRASGTASVRGQAEVESPRVAALSSRRRTIAQRLRLSQDRTVPVTLTTAFDATNLVALRDRYKSASAAVIPAYTDIVACVAARVLTKHPHLASRWEGDDLRAVQPTDAGFDVGVAVHTDDGLLVPVLRGLGRKPLVRVAEESRSLVERARAGKLTAAESQGGMFTITSLGAYGIEAFTPVINYPEIAILGMGAIRAEAVVLDDDRIVSRPRMTLSLTFDHAALDGAPAAAFLRDVAAALTALPAALS